MGKINLVEKLILVKKELLQRVQMEKLYDSILLFAHSPHIHPLERTKRFYLMYFLKLSNQKPFFSFACFLNMFHVRYFWKHFQPSLCNILHELGAGLRELLIGKSGKLFWIISTERISLVNIIFIFVILLDAFLNWGLLRWGTLLGTNWLLQKCKS